LDASAIPAVTPRLAALRLPLAVERMLSNSAFKSEAVSVSLAAHVFDLDIVAIYGLACCAEGVSC
jgi:hypothetical protein